MLASEKVVGRLSQRLASCCPTSHQLTKEAEKGIISVTLDCPVAISHAVPQVLQADGEPQDAHPPPPPAIA